MNQDKNNNRALLLAMYFALSSIALNTTGFLLNEIKQEEHEKELEDYYNKRSELIKDNEKYEIITDDNRDIIHIYKIKDEYYLSSGAKLYYREEILGEEFENIKDYLGTDYSLARK